jgi:hypothetical protein
MGRFDHQLKEDRALRDAARTVFRKELAHVSGEVKPAALGERLADNVGQQVDAASDGAIDFAERHGGKIAATGGALAAGIGLWLARKPILARFAPLFSKGEANSPDTSEDESFADEDSHDE